ncbi:nuclear transport factor 2 family protein [Kribbella sp. NPDC023855]|uniref:nuclear transport factor 2 family protein n=1 Tax=Kribbella sp. NPDC023855 TaxID=3154698 RepID=UPI0033DED1D2
MSDLQATADRLAIQALPIEFADSAMMRDWDRFAGLFTQDGTWRMPHAGMVFTGRDEIRPAIERLQGNWQFFIQTVHLGTIQLDGDTATGRSYVEEFGNFNDGSSHRNYARYHDLYQRTPDGWRFTERKYEVLYVDMTPLTGSPANASTVFDLPAGLQA